tara:strand:+ start:910 stop:1566 length:657 start_codon:yes stop_codon:yes gene_type:complete
MNSAVILAGGSSQRFNSDVPKQFITLKQSKNLIDFSIKAFSENKGISEIILVLPIEWIKKYKERYKDYILISGGKNRYESSYNGVMACSDNIKNVLIHDAARPLITEKIINDCIFYLKKYSAVAPYIDIADSIIYKDGSNYKYLNRDFIKKVQTPQGFNINILKEIISRNKQIGRDDMSNILNTNDNIKTKFFKGDINNFKITNNNDLHLFNKLTYEK